MRFWLLITGIILLALMGCAKASSPYDSSVMELVKTVPTVGNPLDIDVSSSKIYVAEDLAGVAIVDRDSLYVKWYTQVVGLEGTVRNLFKIKNISAVESEHKLFINETNQADEIQIIDTSHPDTLIINSSITGGTNSIVDMNFFPTNDTNNQFSILGAFVTGFEFKLGGYLREFDTWYGFTQQLILPTFLGGFDLTDQYIFLAAKQRGLIIVDRASGAVISELDLPGEANKIRVQGDYAYIVCRQAGLQVVKISDVVHPSLVYSYDTSGYAYSISVNAHYALVGSGGGGVYLFDITNPLKIKLLENNTSCGYVNDVFISDNQAIVAGRDQGILIYQLP
ncbi:MAG TPA: hypothetical protein PLE74_10775 [Candidatus Cloacimonadota bacterium]|nr:hypothetical protein [Candidatus Cloacimonadota bacterium]HPT72751.1 hypothetical protein [Candidatus Cloacimonadota bacterium]